MIVPALKLRKDVAQRLLQFLFRVGVDDEGLVYRLAEPLNGVSRAGAEDFGVWFDREKLGQREIALLKTQPAGA